MSRSLRVLLVDDQRLLRSAFALMLSTEPGIEVVGEAADGQAAVEAAAEHRPDVVLMDVRMPVMDGIEATRRIVAQDTGRVVILTTFDDDEYLFEALRAGASGFLLKNSDPDQLIDAIRAVGDGQALLAPEVTLRVIQQMTSQPAPEAPTPNQAPNPTPNQALSTDPPAGATRRHPGLDRLTEREYEVLVQLGRGHSNSEIAAALFLGEATVKTHVSNVLAKLGVRDRVQAVVVAHESGIIPAAE